MKRLNFENTKATFPLTVIVSRFNTPVTEKLLEGAEQRLLELGFEPSQVTIIKVPGAVEIPLAAKLVAEQRKGEAIVTLGAVIRGETTHYDYVCDQVSQGCQKISLDYNIPVVFGVLTTENAEQAFDRVGGKKGHKGKDAIDTAVEMVLLKRELVN